MARLRAADSEFRLTEWQTWWEQQLPVEKTAWRFEGRSPPIRPGREEAATDSPDGRGAAHGIDRRERWRARCPEAEPVESRAVWDPEAAKPPIEAAPLDGGAVKTFANASSRTLAPPAGPPSDTKLQILLERAAEAAAEATAEQAIGAFTAKLEECVENVANQLAEARNEAAALQVQLMDKLKLRQRLEQELCQCLEQELFAVRNAQDDADDNEIIWGRGLSNCNPHMQAESGTCDINRCFRLDAGWGIFECPYVVDDSGLTSNMSALATDGDGRVDRERSIPDEELRFGLLEEGRRGHRSCRACGVTPLERRGSYGNPCFKRVEDADWEGKNVMSLLGQPAPWYLRCLRCHYGTLPCRFYDRDTGCYRGQICAHLHSDLADGGDSRCFGGAPVGISVHALSSNRARGLSFLTGYYMCSMVVVSQGYFDLTNDMMDSHF